ncbi:MAG: glycosyltransferase family 2 protein [Rhizobiaceae bacterium]
MYHDDLAFLRFPDPAPKKAFVPLRPTVEDEEERLFLSYLFPELAPWRAILRRLALPLDRVANCAALARENGTDFQSELLVSGLVDEDGFYRALASELGVEYLPALDAARLVVGDQHAVSFLRRRAWHIPVRMAGRDGAAVFVVAPERIRPDRMRAMLAARPAIAGRLRLTTPNALRAALFERVRMNLARAAASDLFDRHPSCSARIVLNAWQACFIGAAAVAFPVMLAADPVHTWAALHFFFSFFFLACVGLRFSAIQAAVRPSSGKVRAARPASLPTFSILVALYRESEIVPHLLARLDGLAWPRSKLDVKLVCEEDDRDTLAALAARRLPPWIEVVRVPVHGPRTKPKALAYALPLARGELVGLYDAEDQPGPMQLMEAWRRFEEGGPKLACVQAPLEISNRRAGPVSLMFHFEYAALFRGILPWLSSLRLLLPLGGTSNHFRRAVLEKVGGWDPYNVTEDADLGLRLARFGYRTETISTPTFEAAPLDIRTWIPQRTRWFKGWVQSWLVHMRNPWRTASELGIGSFIIMQILFAGMVLSALAHPFLIVTAFVLAAELFMDRPMGVLKSLLFAVDVTNIACGYTAFLLLGWQSLRGAERLRFWRVVMLTPVYWLLMSFAAWRAIWQLVRQPHLWEKTPHPAPKG